MSSLPERYGSKPIDYYENTRFDVVNKIKRSPKRILDVGCGAGNTLRYLKSKFPESLTVGIEGFPEAANAAREVCDQVHCLNLNDCNFDKEQLGEFDLIICSDVLEHLLEPCLVLTRLKNLLKDNGEIIVSLPNIRFIGVLLPLIILDRFEYTDAGVLDKTHLRFFTKSSAKKMIERSGYIIESISPSLDSGISYTRILGLLTLGLAAGLTSRQFIFKAKKTN